MTLHRDSPVGNEGKKTKGFIYKIFLEHPYQAGEGYWQHLFFTLRYGFYVILTGIIFIIHGLFPCLFQTTAGDRTFKLAELFQQRRQNFLKTKQDNDQI